MHSECGARWSVSRLSYGCKQKLAAIDNADVDTAQPRRAFAQVQQTRHCRAARKSCRKEEAQRQTYVVLESVAAVAIRFGVVTPHQRAVVTVAGHCRLPPILKCAPNPWPGCGRCLEGRHHVDKLAVMGHHRGVDSVIVPSANVSARSVLQKTYATKGSRAATLGRANGVGCCGAKGARGAGGCSKRCKSDDNDMPVSTGWR